MTPFSTWPLSPRPAVPGGTMEDGHELDLTYVTERVIAVSFPAGCSEEAYLHGLQEVTRMLRSKHGDNYLVSSHGARGRGGDVGDGEGEGARGSLTMGTVRGSPGRLPLSEVAGTSARPPSALGLAAAPGAGAPSEPSGCAPSPEDPRASWATPAPQGPARHPFLLCLLVFYSATTSTHLDFL